MFTKNHPIVSSIGIPFLNLTPLALHRVFGPVGPMRHCGVFWHPQFKHPRRIFKPSAVKMLSVALGVYGVCAAFALGAGPWRLRLRDDLPASPPSSGDSLSSKSVLSPLDRKPGREVLPRARLRPTELGELTSV